MFKQCTKCGRSLSLDNFGVDKSKKDSFCSHCNQCRKQYYIKNKDSYGIRSKNDYLINKELRKTQFWKNHIFRTYGITYEEFLDIVKSQNYSCKICGNKFGDLQSKKVHIDHNHITGKVRGVLCKFCNCHLVAMLEHPLKKAAEQYLRENV